MVCSLNYIPKRIHTANKPIVENFEIGEELYYRCKPINCSRPYDNISLYDISHNRNFRKNKLFLKEDVLFNIIEDSEETKYRDVEILTLKVNNISKSTYEKEIICDKNPNIIAKITLIHTPLPCMYSHSAFQIEVNDVIVNKDNYKVVLNKKNATYKSLRRDIRQDLTSMLQTGIIDDSNNIENITEL